MNRITPGSPQIHYSAEQAANPAAEQSGSTRRSSSARDNTGLLSSSSLGMRRLENHKLSKNPAIEKSFMSEFTRSGMAQVIHGKKAAYWNSCEKKPDRQELEAMAQRMSEQLGIPASECKPVFPQKPVEAVSAIIDAANAGRCMLNPDYAVMIVEDADKKFTHVCIINKPELYKVIEKSPRDFGLPLYPTAEAIHCEVDNFANPDNFLNNLRNEKRFSAALSYDEHDIKLFMQTKTDFAKKNAMKHPANEIIGEISSSSYDAKNQQVIPVGQIYFKGKNTETNASNNIQDALEINETLSQIHQQHPEEKYSDVVFRDTLNRLYYPPEY